MKWERAATILTKRRVLTAEGELNQAIWRKAIENQEKV
jgi:hypothetical protein